MKISHSRIVEAEKIRRIYKCEVWLKNKESHRETPDLPQAFLYGIF